MLSVLSLLALLSAPSRADTISLIGNSTSRGNCIPFGSNYNGSSTSADYHGFVYQNVGAFELRSGDTISFDLFAENDNTIITDIAFATATSNGSMEPDSSGFTTVVSSGTPADPDGNTTYDDFELEFTVDSSFSFGGGGLIVRFQAKGGFRSDTTCDQVLTASYGSDTSGYFVGRFHQDPDGGYPWYDTDDYYIGHVLIDWVGVWCDDSDGDGYGDPSTCVSGTEPSGYVNNDEDCDDTDASINPDAAEVCDGDDNDCDGDIDDDDDDTETSGMATFYADDDSDGFGDAGSDILRCDVPSGYVSDDTDCDDARAAINPDADELCATSVDDDCDGDINEDDAIDAPTWYGDGDGDGYGAVHDTTLACTEPSGYVSDDTDCDDTDSANYPGASESADGVDNDCDGTVDEGTDYADEDGDGYAPAGGDCDDADASINPGASEAADGIDNDCDGDIDEGTDVYDDDGDGYSEDDGDCDDSDAAVSPAMSEVADNAIDDDCDGVVDSGLWDEDGDGFLPEGGDCDDEDAAIYPGAGEVLDGIDNDCDGTIDEGTDAYDDDGDGLSEDEGDCDDGSAARSPDNTETFDGIDNDCDGIVDNGTDAYDDDGDGYSELGGDCDDEDAAIAPGAEELEDGVDNDCDGLTDEAFDTDDVDGDGVIASDDCDDSDGWAYPGAEEFCDGTDNDCDGDIDEDAVCGEIEESAEPRDEGKSGCATTGGLASTVWLLGVAGLLARRRRREVGVLSVAGLVGCAGVETNVHSIEPVLESEILMLDLGAQTVGGGAEATLSLYSTGSGRVTIDDIEIIDDAGAAFEVAEGWSESLEADTEAVLTVRFSPEAVGWHRGALIVYSDAVDGPLSVELRGHALEALLGVWPPQLDFGPVSPGTSKEAVVTVFNDGRLPVDLSEVVASGPFSVSTDAVSLGAGEEAPLTVTFSPTDDAPAAGALDVQFVGVGSVSASLSGNDCALGSPSAYDQDGDGHTSCAADCDDGDDQIHPGADELLDGIDNDCDGTIDEGTDAYDDDGDGYTEEEGDCDDASATTHVGASEVADNGIDDDCDGIVDDGRPDPDGDGFAVDGGDCDDADATIHPGADEVADGIDNDCDGTVDEGTAAYDDDGDGYTEEEGDCDDSASTTGPDSAEVADWVDNDCDGTVDEGTDAYDDDGDGFTENGGDCDDTDASVSPADPEVLSDGIDNDCDGTAE